MAEIRTRHLFDMEADLQDSQMVGQTPRGQRLVAIVRGGSFRGERLSGQILPGGGDWAVIGADLSLAIDVRATLATEDGDLIYATYQGRWIIPPEKFAEVLDPTTGPAVDPAGYYFRTAPMFETGSTKYGWLNGVVAVGTGRRTATGVAYRVFEVL